MSSLRPDCQTTIIDVEIKHFDDFNDHKTVLKDIESKVTFAINMLKTIQN
jgi:hypothetical protein